MQVKEGGEQGAGAEVRGGDLPDPLIAGRTVPGMSETAFLVMSGAIDGTSPRAIARAIGKSKSTVDTHLKKLLGWGYLVVVGRNETGAPIYAPGDAGGLPRSDGRGGGHPPDEPTVPVRIHRGSWRFEVRWIGRLAEEPRWEKTWRVERPLTRQKPVEHFRMSWGEWGFWLALGAERQTLVVDLPHEAAFTPAEVRNAEARRGALVRDAAASFASEFGAQLYGQTAARCTPTEYGFAVPGARPWGRPGKDLVWVDGSLGEGTAEIETQVVAIAEDFLAAPEVARRVAHRKAPWPDSWRSA